MASADLNRYVVRTAWVFFAYLICTFTAEASAGQNGNSGAKPLELKPIWTVNLKAHGSRTPHGGFINVPYDPGSTYSVACTQTSIAVTIDSSVVFFDPATGEALETRNLSSAPGEEHPYGFIRIFSTPRGHFFLDLHETTGEMRHRVLLLGSRGEDIKVLDLSIGTEKNPWGVIVSITGESFLLTHFSEEPQHQLRDAETFVVRQTWTDKAAWQSLSDNKLIRILGGSQPLGRGNRAGKEQPLQIASPGMEPQDLGHVVAGEAAILNDERILVIHVNDLAADLVDDHGQVLRRYEVPFRGGHAYFGLAGVASDAQHFAAHFLGQKSAFLPGREYLYIWDIENSQPVASVQFKWTSDESESAFCSGSTTFAVVNDGKLQLFNTVETSKSPVPKS